MKKYYKLNKYIIEIYYANKFIPILLEYTNKEDAKTDVLRINQRLRTKSEFLLIYKTGKEIYINCSKICYFEFYQKEND